ncbi:MAG: carboxypeptidase-like regulatory domain-containing protein, partial [Candidatus Odinarchaeota archaeon]
IISNLQIWFDGMERLLFNSTTGSNGYISFTISIPANLNAGTHSIKFELTPLSIDGYHRGISKIINVIVLRETEIIHLQEEFLIRQQKSWFNATAVDSQGLPVTTGALTLTLGDETLYSSGNPGSFLYTVPSDAARGISIFTWYYSDNEQYKDSQISFPVAIYSVPAFVNLDSSSTEAFPYEEIQVSGQLTEETGTGVSEAKITVTHKDNWGNKNNYEVLTDEQGAFVFSYRLESDSNGIHYFTIEFSGWTDEYYLPIQGKPVFEVSVDPLVSLIVPRQLVANESALLEIQGKKDLEVTLEVLENAEWLELAVFNLDSQGHYSYEWLVGEHLRGETFLRASYTGSEQKTIFQLEVYVRPELVIEAASSSILTGEEVDFLVTCSEEHAIFKDGIVWQENLSPGSRLFTLVFKEPEDHVITIKTTGQYVVETVKKMTIQVREDYSVSINIPQRVQKSKELTIDICIVDSEQQPLEGFKIELVINSTLMATTMTSQSGTAVMNVSLNKGHYAGIIRLNPADSSIHASKEIEIDSFTVYSVPAIRISDLRPVAGGVVNIEIMLKDGLDPVTGDIITVYLKGTSETSFFIGSNVTDDLGIVKIPWNITQEKGEYLLQVENVGNDLLESIIITKAVTVLERGPEILMATVVVQNSDNNLYLVTATIEFPGGKGSVYLCANDNRNIIGTLQETENLWILPIQLPKGQHYLWLQVVDAQGVENWKDLGMIIVLNDLPAGSETTGSVKSDNIARIITDTFISAMLMLPVAAYIVYRKRGTLIKQ